MQVVEGRMLILFFQLPLLAAQHTSNGLFSLDDLPKARATVGDVEDSLLTMNHVCTLPWLYGWKYGCIKREGVGLSLKFQWFSDYAAIRYFADVIATR